MRKILSLVVNGENFFRLIKELNPNDPDVKRKKECIISFEPHFKDNKLSFYQLLAKLNLESLLTSKDPCAKKMSAILRAFNKPPLSKI